MKKAFAAQRRNMIDCQIKPFSVNNERILSAFEAVPREKYLPENKREHAYVDADLNLGEGRFLIAPSVYARLLQSAEIQAGEAVRDVGSSEYTTAILQALGAEIVDGQCDLAVINGAIEEIPDDVATSVKEGGRIATFVHADGRGYAAIFRKQGGEWSETPVFDAFVPVLEGFKSEKGFTF